MPAVPKTGQALFLGLELATDQLRATIVDESLELVGVECVDFDTELSEYQTQGGIFTTPGDAYTTPVEMWIKGLDTLLEKLSRNHDLSRIKSIGGAAQHALVWWKSTTVPSLSSLDPHVLLYNHFPSQSFSLPNTPIAQDTSSHTHALAIEALLGGPDHMVNRVGTCASASLVAAQLLRIRESWPQDVWARTGRVQLASAFMGSLIAGKWMAMGEAEACATGMWVHSAHPSSVNAGQPGAQGYWDETVLDIVGGSREEGRRVRGWLGEVDVSGGGRRAGNVSRYLVERYGFDPDTIVAPFTSDYLSSYLSLLPSPNDAVLSFGPMDTLMTPAQHYLPTRLYNLFPHPVQDSGDKKKYIAVLSSRNADVPRALVRDMYTKSWSAFDRLVAIVPPGGSIGLDDKLFSFWYLQADSYPFSHVKGIFRFETGVKVNEFRDLRANPRCLIESQILSFRVKWSRMIATGLLGSARKGGISPAPPLPGRSSSTLSSLGLPFDPYDHIPLPSRIITTGAAANFPSVANLVGDAFNAPVFVPSTQVDSAQVVPHRNAPAQGFPGRAALGGSYVARWVWGREWGAGGLSVFEDEMRRLLGKRWVATGGMPLRTNVNGAVGGGGLAVGGSSGANSGSSTPYGHPGSGGRSGLGATVFVEEDEDEELERERVMNSDRAGLGLSPGVIGGGLYGAGASPGVGGAGTFVEIGFGSSRLRTQTSSTVDSLSSLTSGPSPSTAFTTPDLNLNSLGVISPALGTNGGSTAAPSTPTPLTPVVALPTADAEAQIGLAKVAEPDIDAFMTYAAIVPEYCRLEGMLVKGIV
ncbi:putative D-xylulose kinase A [Hypsizygus marmoreus]|uniref:D-xylulose kinase A n=1 Tax=Hypsizygus marmoreus TaxID=39966 RepID=A0A369JSV5_HYPMA|nr:putative D-xylulose kinase A [Hypsizygus marmoreus]